MNEQLANRLTARLGMAGAFASAMLFVAPTLAQDSRLSLSDRVARLEQQSQNQSQGGIGMVNQVQALQSQVQQLQGQIEELQHALQQAQDTSKAQYVDLDSRISQLQKGAAPAAAPSNGSPSHSTPAPAAAASAAQGAGNPSAAGSSPAAGDSAAAQAAYGVAFKDLRAGDYAKASREFRGFLEQYPGHPLTPNALYWLGESYYVTMNYQVALEAFQKLAEQYPQSEKAPDALLKVGYTQYELKQVDAAKATLKSVGTKFPNSKAAALAEERLRRIQAQPAS